jgi:hypothetical protein
LLEFPDRVLEIVALVAAVAAIGGWEYLFGHSLVILFFFCSQRLHNLKAGVLSGRFGSCGCYAIRL